MNCDTNPLEAGLDYFIKLNKVTIPNYSVCVVGLFYTNLLFRSKFPRSLFLILE